MTGGDVAGRYRHLRRGVYPGSFNPATVAHLAVAEAALEQCGLATVELVISVDPLGKDAAGQLALDRRLAALHTAAATRAWLDVRTTTARLLVDIAHGADVLVVGADKWAQLVDPAWYGSVDERDVVLRRLPLVAVAPRPPHPLPDPDPGRVVLLDVHPDHHHISATAVREGRHDWVLPEAAHLVAPNPDHAADPDNLDPDNHDPDVRDPDHAADPDTTGDQRSDSRSDPGDQRSDSRSDTSDHNDA